MNAHYIESHTLIRAENGLEFVLSQKTGIHKYAAKLVAYGLVKQQTGHAGIHTAGKRQDYLIVTELLPELAYRGLHEILRSPVPRTSAYSKHEVGQEFLAAFAVIDLRMELYSPGRLIRETESSIVNTAGRAYDYQFLRKPYNGISMRHPYSGLLWKS